MTTHQGSCQCGSVAYEVETELDGVIECNCSHCYRKGLALIFVSPDAFHQTAGEGALSEHSFNTHRITHLFCKTCGVQAFARGVAPNSQPMVAVNVRTLMDVEPWSWSAQRVDGRNF